MGSFRTKNKCGGCYWVEIFVLLELNIVVPASPIKNLQGNLALELMHPR